MMRRARPSTIAVLPTPGSPIRTGLFFFPTAQNLNGPADFVVPPDYGIQLALPGLFRQVLTELGQGFPALAISGAIQVVLVELFNLRAVDPIFAEQGLHLRAAVAGQGTDQMAHGNRALPGFARHDRADAGKVRTHEQLPVLSFDGRNPRHQVPRFPGKGVAVDVEGLQEEFEEILAAQGCQQVGARHFLIVVHDGLLLGRLQKALDFFGIIFIHMAQLLFGYGIIKLSGSKISDFYRIL